MKVGVYRPVRLPRSLDRYMCSVMRELEFLGVRFSSFTDSEAVPENVDLLWDPRAADGALPEDRITAKNKPIAVTLFGARSFVIPGHRAGQEEDSRAIWIRINRVGSQTL